MSGRSKELEEELFREPSQVQDFSGGGLPLCASLALLRLKAGLLIGPWLPVVRFGAGYFSSLNVSFLISKIKMRTVL